MAEEIRKSLRDRILAYIPAYHQHVKYLGGDSFRCNDCKLE